MPKACTILIRINLTTHTGSPASMAITKKALATEVGRQPAPAASTPECYDTHLLPPRSPVRCLSHACGAGSTLCQYYSWLGSGRALDPQRGARLWSGPAPDAFFIYGRRHPGGY